GDHDHRDDDQHYDQRSTHAARLPLSSSRPPLITRTSPVKRSRSRRSCDTVTIERGEIPAGTDPGAVVRTAVAPLHYRLFLTRERIDGKIGDQAVAAALAATRAGVFAQSPKSALPSRKR